MKHLHLVTVSTCVRGRLKPKQPFIKPMKQIRRRCARSDCYQMRVRAGGGDIRPAGPAIGDSHRVSHLTLWLGHNGPTRHIASTPLPLQRGNSHQWQALRAGTHCNRPSGNAETVTNGRRYKESRPARGASGGFVVRWCYLLARRAYSSSRLRLRRRAAATRARPPAAARGAQDRAVSPVFGVALDLLEELEDVLVLVEEELS